MGEVLKRHERLTNGRRFGRRIATLESTTGQTYNDLAGSIAAWGVNLEDVEERLRAQRVETPSWGYGDTGTRFAVFPQAGGPRGPLQEKADDAETHTHTRIFPSGYP